MPITASATHTGTFNIGDGTWDSGDDAMHKCSWSSNVLTVNNGANVTITGNHVGMRRVAIAAGATATVTLDGASISIGLSPPILLNSNANLTLNLVNSNTLINTGIAPGIETTDATLTINGPGSLTVSGGHSAAGIGGGNNAAGGTVTINGGTVTANGGNNGAGIGGGYNGAGGNITINGGTVTATGGNQAGSDFDNGPGAGIGGGGGGSNQNGGGAGGTIVISGGTVTATGGKDGANPKGVDIGGNSGGTVTITGGTVTGVVKAVTKNDFRDFGPPPPTGLPDLTVWSIALYALIALSLSLWCYVGYAAPFSKK